MPKEQSSKLVVEEAMKQLPTSNKLDEIIARISIAKETKEDIGILQQILTIQKETTASPQENKQWEKIKSNLYISNDDISIMKDFVVEKVKQEALKAIETSQQRNSLNARNSKNPHVVSR